MKTFFKAITLTAAMVTVSGVYAAEAQKIGVVIPSKIMQESPQRESMIKKLEAEFKGRYEEILALETEIKKLEAKIKQDGELLSANELTSLQRDIQEKVSAYKLKRKNFEEDNRQRQSEEQQKASKQLIELIDAVATEEGYDLILNGEQVVFVKPELDISDKVIQKMSTK